MQLQAKGFPSTVKSSQAKPSHSDTYIKRPIHHETCLPQQTTSGPRVDHQFLASDSYAVCILRGLKPAIISEAQAGHFFSVHPTFSLAVFILHLSEKFQCSHVILGRCIFLLLCSLASTWQQGREQLNGSSSQSLISVGPCLLHYGVARGKCIGIEV